MSDIPLSQPDITEAEINAVVGVLRSGRLSIGPRQDLLEQMIADRCGRRHGIAISSGTAGLHLCLAALGIGPGDEVLTTPFSFVASANCILMVGATPKFVDIDPTSLNLDPEKLERAITPKTKAVVAVEVFGNPTHMDRVEGVCRAHEIPLIEDSCEGLGGSLNGRPIGNFGRASVFGFYPNKQITTGEGGVIVTDDDRVAELCRSMRNQGRSATQTPQTGAGPSTAGSWLAHERMGYNYRLSEIAAALGVVQMERLDEILGKRRRVASYYMRHLLDVEDLILPNLPRGCERDFSWFVFVVRLAHGYTAADRDQIIDGLRRHEVGASNYFPCIHLQPFYRQSFGFKSGDFPVAESISQRTIALPFFPALEESQVQIAARTLRVMLQRVQLRAR